MRSVVCLVVSVLALNCISAQFIDWDALQEDVLQIFRPSPPKRPVPPMDPEDDILVPPSVGQNGWNAQPDSLKVQIITTDDLEAVPPAKVGIEHRPFEAGPFPPFIDESPIIADPPSVPLQPWQPLSPPPQPQQGQQSKPVGIAINVNRPGHSGQFFDVNLHKVDNGIAEPTPKYPYRPH